mmetsp:Transcript_41686/g.126432  ORF Transcript_41686/g.126432 Transcript_41686/m.126432 type:complete len:89 (-) Transcript_41686:889-1155(-)
MGVIALASGMEAQNGPKSSLKNTQTVGCILAAMNFALPVLLWKGFAKILSRRKSPLWLSTFYYYCICMTVFWTIAAYKNQNRVIQKSD